jgi:hypothetical protein
MCVHRSFFRVVRGDLKSWKINHTHNDFNLQLCRKKDVMII